MTETPATNTILIRNVTAIPMARRGEVLQHVDILIEGHQIAALAPTGSISPTPPSRAGKGAGGLGPASAPRVLDATGKLALPGFVNAHNHVALALLKAASEAMPLEPWLAWLIPRQLQMDPADHYWSSLLTCLEQTRHGITTFADMYGREDLCAEAIETAGLRAVISMSVMEPDPQSASPAEGLARLERSLQFAQAWQGRGAGRITTRLAPHSVYTVRPDLLRAFARLAAQHGLGLQVHCSETETEVANCLARHGRTPPALLHETGCLEVPILLAHAVHLTDDDLALLDRPQVGLSHNPGSNLKLQSGLARLPELVDRQLAVGLGTDSTASNDTQDLLKEAYLAAVLHPWPPGSEPSWRALELATIGGARALGLADQIGTLEPGKRADLILLDLADPRHAPGLDPVRHLVYTGRGADVVTTIVDGEILMEDRLLRRLDSAEIIAQSRPRARRLLAETS
jgi:5-methylthioadenosine/S-adenosylhomocysteine deaminase